MRSNNFQFVLLLSFIFFIATPHDTLAQSPNTNSVPKKSDTTRNPGNALFNKTGVLVNSASAFPVDHYAAKLKMANVSWIALQIDNGGAVREDSASSLKSGWADQWRAQGFKVGFWGCPRGVGQHNSQAEVDKAIPNVQADAALAAKLTAKYHGDFYIADCEDHFQGYNQKDPAPALNRVYVDAFQKAASEHGITNIPRALSSMGRVALDMEPWIKAGWDAMPQAYWNSYAVYQPSLCVDFYVKSAGWPIERVHPTIATFRGEGEDKPKTLQEYDADLKSRATTGFSFYLPESYLKDNDSDYKQLSTMGNR